MPCVFVVALVQLESYHTVRLPVVVLALTWGIVCVYIASAIENNVIQSLDLNQFTLTTVIAPVTEEVLKSSFLIIAYIFVLIRYSGDATIYGFAVGSGFAIVENSIYMLIEPLNQYLATGTVTESSILGAALIRSVSTALVHGGITAMVMTAASFIIYYRGGRALLAGIGVIIGAILLHVTFNALLWIDNEQLIVIGAVLLGAANVIMLVVLMNFNVRHEYNQIVKELHYDPMKILSQMVVENGKEVTVLEHIRHQYGRRQQKLVERYLSKQGQVAVYAEHLDDGDQRPRVIRSLNRDIKIDRRRSHRIYKRMKPEVQQWLHQVNLVDAVPVVRNQIQV